MALRQRSQDSRQVVLHMGRDNQVLFQHDSFCIFRYRSR